MCFLELAVFKCVSPNCLFLIKEFRILDSTLLDWTNSFSPSQYIEEISEVERGSLSSVLNNANIVLKSYLVLNVLVNVCYPINGKTDTRQFLLLIPTLS